MQESSLYKDKNIESILHGGTKIWILSSSDENNISQISVENE